MNQTKRILLFFVLPALAPLLLPPAMLGSGIVAVGIEIALFIILGIFLMRGNSTALTLSIFLQGLNVIVRLMMFFPNAMVLGQIEWVMIIASILSIGLSAYLVLRLDNVDVRTQMIT